MEIPLQQISQERFGDDWCVDTRGNWPLNGCVCVKEQQNVIPMSTVYATIVYQFP